MGHDFNDVTLDQGAEAVIAAVHNAQAPEPAPAIKIDVELIAADQVQMQPIRWLWPGWLAAGKFHLLGGAPGTGKTTLALAATLTTAGRWPDATRCTHWPGLRRAVVVAVADRLVLCLLRAAPAPVPRCLGGDRRHLGRRPRAGPRRRAIRSHSSLAMVEGGEKSDGTPDGTAASHPCAAA